MNPRVSPAAAAKSAALFAGKNGIPRNLNNHGGNGMASHTKGCAGSTHMNFNPGVLDLVPVASTATPAATVASCTSSTKHNKLNLRDESSKARTEQTKTPLPVIALNSSKAEVTYTEAEAILVSSGKNWRSTAGAGGDGEKTQKSHRISCQKTEEPDISRRGSLSKDEQLSHLLSSSTDKSVKLVNNVDTVGVKDSETSFPLCLLNGRRKTQSTRSHSFHADVGDSSRAKVQRSQSMSSTEHVRRAVREQEYCNTNSTGLDQIRHRSRLENHMTALKSSSLPAPLEVTTIVATTALTSITPRSEPATSSASGRAATASTKRDAGHGLSVRFADFEPGHPAGVYLSSSLDVPSPSYRSRSLGPAVSSVDAALRMCRNTPSKKIYIDTVKKQPHNGTADHKATSDDHARRLDISKDKMDASFHLNGQEKSQNSLCFQNDIKFYSVPSQPPGSLQHTRPDGLSDIAFLRRLDKAIGLGGGVEGRKGDTPTVSLSPSVSFVTAYPLKTFEPQKQMSEKTSGHSFGSLTHNNTSTSSSYNNITTVKNSNGLYSLTPSSSLSSTSSSLSKEAANSHDRAPSASPSTPSTSQNPQPSTSQHPQPSTSQHRNRLPSGASPEEPPFSLMLMSSSSSSSLLIPASSPSISPTALAGLQSFSSSSASSSSSTSNPSTVTSIAHKPSPSIAPTRPSSACLRSDCVLPGIRRRTTNHLDYLLSPTARSRRFPTLSEQGEPGIHQTGQIPCYTPDLASANHKPRLIGSPSSPLSVATDSPTLLLHSARSDTKSGTGFPLTSPSAKESALLGHRLSHLTSSTSSSSDVGSSISSSATSLSSGKVAQQLSPYQTSLFHLSSASSPTSSPSLPSKTASESRASLASLIKKESIAASYQLEYCWFCGRPMPPFGTSLSGGEEHLEKLAELEKLLAQAQSEKVKLVEEQVRIRESEMLALQKNEVLERELQQVKLRERHSQMQARPMTRFLPNTSRDFDLRAHVEGAGHLLDACPHVIITTHSCRGWLHKMGGRIKTWKKRWFVFDRMKRKVFYFTDKTELKLKGSVCFQAIEEVYADHLKTVKSPSPKLTFCMKTFDRTYFLVAPSPETMTIWIDVLFSGAEGYQQFYDS